MTSTLQLSEEMSAGPARLRIDVLGAQPVEHVRCAHAVERGVGGGEVDVEQARSIRGIAIEEDVLPIQLQAAVSRSVAAVTSPARMRSAPARSPV